MTMLLMANGAGEVYVNGKRMTSWRRSCTLQQIRIPQTPSVIAVYVDKLGDSAAFGMSLINATNVPPSDAWRCVLQEASTDWMRSTFVDTSWPFANSRLHEPCPSLPISEINSRLVWTHLTYTSQWHSVQLYCRLAWMSH